MRTRYIFGDIHGHYDTLLSLLKQLKIEPDAVPDDVELIFLGDLIDRGPNSADVVELVRRIVDSGHGHCILANHEFNFVNFNTETHPGSGIYRRPRNNKNLSEIAETWSSYRQNGKHNSSLLDQHVAWFRSLPVAIEFEDLNLVHACWHADSLAHLTKTGDRYFLSDEQWNAAWVKDKTEFDAIEILCKGYEQTLPNDGYFYDKGGVKRRKARVRWWNEQPRNWEEYMIAPGVDLTTLSGEPPSNRHLAVTKPTLFGHYWMQGKPRLLNNLASCLDFSVAAPSGGYLCAYEFREGDTKLYEDRLHFAPTSTT